MTKLTCKITEAIQKDFNSLWKCKQIGKTLEISTPYLLPDSTLFSVFITERSGRYIVCDGGSISEILSEYCPLPEDEIQSSLEGLSAKFSIKVGTNSEKQNIFFKDCDKESLISSIVFDVANFAITSTNALVVGVEDELDIEENRFPTKADAFLKLVIPPDYEFHPRHEIAEVPGVRFSAVIKRTNRIWVVSYVNGSNLTYFRRNLAETVLNFSHARRSSVSNYIARTIPILNDEAGGYRPDKLKWQLDELHKTSQESIICWKDRNNLSEWITA